jgi:DNA-binding IclR family transcriptional regulator
MSTSELRELGREGLRRLVAKFGDTAHLGVLDGPEVLFLEREAGTRSVVVPGAKIGDRAVAAHFAIGKALLVGRGRDELSRLYSLDGRNPALQSKGSAPLRISLQELFTELADIPRTRCAFNLTPEITAVGTPIWDYSDTVVAALSVCLPTYRYKSLSKQVIEAVIGTAEWISLGLGVSSPSRRRWKRLDMLAAKPSIAKIPS